MCKIKGIFFHCFGRSTDQSCFCFAEKKVRQTFCFVLVCVFLIQTGARYADVFIDIVSFTTRIKKVFITKVI